ncbi:hypothetical protein WJX79_010793 [Trebouxia sp. C0005]
MGCSTSKNIKTSGPEPEQATLNKVPANVVSAGKPGLVSHDVPVQAGTTTEVSTAGGTAWTTGTSAPSQLPAGTKIIFVLGGPGSGKGTQCDRIVAKYKLTHLSAGDLLREESKSGSETGQTLDSIMKEGKLVPQEITIGLLKKAMLKSGSSSFLIDGFPRALDQAQSFEEQIQPCDMVLFFDCPLDVMEQRLMERGKTSGRSDDNEETIRKRFKTFNEESMPVVEKYASLGKAHKISAVPPPEEVFLEVEKILQPVFVEDTFSGETVAVQSASVVSNAQPTIMYSKRPSANWGNQTSQAQASQALLDMVPKVDGQLSPDTKILFVLGGPGSGKGTQCALIKAKYGYTHLSSGYLLRDEVKSGSQLGVALDTTMKNGDLVPTEVTIALLRNAMIKSSGDLFLVDGFPRALDQAETFERDILPCQMVLYFECTEATMEERLTERGKTSGRSDDNPETMRKRFHTFVNSSMPVVDHYERQGKLHKISAAAGTPDDIFQHVQKILDPTTTS